MTDNDRAEQIALIQEAVRPLLMELIRAWRTPEPMAAVMRGNRWGSFPPATMTEAMLSWGAPNPTPQEPTKEEPETISAVWTRNADRSVTATFPKLIDECPEEGADPRCKWKSASCPERTCRYLVSTDQQKHTVRCGYPSVHMDGVTETDI